MLPIFVTFLITATHNHLTFSCAQCSTRRVANDCIQLKEQSISLFEVPLKQQCSSLGVSFPFVLFQCAQNCPLTCLVEQTFKNKHQYEECRGFHHLSSQGRQLLNSIKQSTKINSLFEGKYCICSPNNILGTSQQQQLNVQYSRSLEEEIVEKAQSGVEKDAKNDIYQLKHNEEEENQWWAILIGVVIMIFACIGFSCTIYHIIECCKKKNQPLNDIQPPPPPQYPQPQLNPPQNQNQLPPPEDPRYQVQRSVSPPQSIQSNLFSIQEYPQLQSQRDFQGNRRN